MYVLIFSHLQLSGIGHESVLVFQLLENVVAELSSSYNCTLGMSMHQEVIKFFRKLNH